MKNLNDIKFQWKLYPNIYEAFLKTGTVLHRGSNLNDSTGLPTSMEVLLILMKVLFTY